jgi:kynurenine formamidase
MERIIDLTHPIIDRMQVFPGDEPVQVRKIRNRDVHGFTDFRLKTGMHAGTHIDGPMHLTESTLTIAALPLDRFVGRGVVVDAREMQTIECRDSLIRKIGSGAIVLFFTGHDRWFGSARYFTEYPVLAEEWAHVLIDKKIRMIGLDTPSPDREPFPVHKALLTHGIGIIENLTGIEQVAKAPSFELWALPLKIEADSSLARVLARITEY